MPLRYYHFSIDDVLDSLLEASDQSDELFQHEFFDFLQRFHDRFNVNVDLYVFLQKQIGATLRTLDDVSGSLLPSFRDVPWIGFGPHARDDETPPFAQCPDDQRAFCESVYDQILRFAGPERCSRWVRLHYFSECFELGDYFQSRGVKALLTTDKPAISYRLPANQTDQLKRHGFTEYSGIGFIRSHVRLENLVERSLSERQLHGELDRLCGESTCAVIFTHEYELARPEVRDMAFRVGSWLESRQLESVDGSMTFSNLALD